VKIATLEPSRIADEQQDFDNIVETRSPDRSYNGNYSSRLSAEANKPLGPVTMLPVQRGDSLTMSTFANYQVGSPQGKSWALAAFVSSLFNSTAPPPPGTEGYRNGKYTPYIGLALGASIAALPTEEGVPNAYLKYIVLDQDSNYVYNDVQVISSAAGQSWQELKLHYKVEQDGYVQVFVYNESGQEVFFDDINIRKDPALIVQENHYDPWGMNLVGIEKQGRPDHKFQYNGIEKQEEFSLNVNMAKFRVLDPQLGRWWQIDPIVEGFESLTPYNSNMNNPIRYDDPDGDCPTCPPTQWEMNAVASGEMGRGIVDSFVGTATGLWNVVTSPVETAKGLYNAFTSPIETGKSIYVNTVNEFKTNPERSAGKVVGGGLQIVIGIGIAKQVKNASSIGNKFDKTADVSRKGNLGNPFKGKTLEQVQEGFESQVKLGKLEPKYSSPVSGSKSYINKKSGYSYNVDTGINGKTGVKREGSHVDVNYPNPKPNNVPDKRKFDIE
jgi:RHS repeat-associated protein